MILKIAAVLNSGRYQVGIRPTILLLSSEDNNSLQKTASYHSLDCRYNGFCYLQKIINHLKKTATGIDSVYSKSFTSRNHIEKGVSC